MSFILSFSPKEHGPNYVFSRLMLSFCALFCLLVLPQARLSATPDSEAPTGLAQVTVIIDDLQFRPDKGSASSLSRSPGFRVTGSGLTVAPNPATTSVTLTADTGVDFTYLSIRNSEGLTIFSTAVNGSNSHDVSMSPGYYYFVISTNSTVITELVQIVSE